MTQLYTLKSMAHNYRNGHSWDHLDSEVCLKAADEIKQLQTEVAQLNELVQKRTFDLLACGSKLKTERGNLSTVIKLLQGR